MAGDRFVILLVCRTNLCCSPLAERLARKAITDRMGQTARDFEVSSAGTDARGGQLMHPLAADVLHEQGANETNFRSRRLSTDLIMAADLTLTATRRQRAACVALAPATVRRTFTLPQFGRLAAAMPQYSLTAIWPPQGRLRAMIEELFIIRGGLPVAPFYSDDLEDPVQHPIEVFRRCAGEIQGALDTMINLIAPI